MAKRMIKHQKWVNFEHTLKSGETAEAGHIAAIELSSGLIVEGATALGLLPIGTFIESLTGDGTKKARVRLSKELDLYAFANDSNPNDVQVGDIGNDCYVKDSETVSMSSATNTRSIAGRVWGLHNGQVLVQLAGP